MPHRVRYLHAGRPAIDEHSASLALQRRQQGARRLQVHIIHLQGDGELAFPLLHHVSNGRKAAAARQQRGRSEDLLAQRRIGQEAFRVDREQCRAAVVRASPKFPTSERFHPGARG